MSTFQLRTPIEAAQYSTSGSVAAVSALLRQTGRRFSHDNFSGDLRFYDGGPEVIVPQGSWAVLIGGEIAILSAQAFDAAFTGAD